MDFHSRMRALRQHLTQWLMRSAFSSSAPSISATGALPLTGIHRILVCRNVRTLGDSLTLTPLLQELRRAWPGAELDLVSRCPVAEEIYGTYFCIGRIIPLPTHSPGHPIRTLRALQQMRSTHYDLAIDPDPQSQSGRLLTILARKTRSLGFSGPYKSGKTTYSVRTADMPRHHAAQPVFLLRSALGEPLSARPYPRLDIRLTPVERQQGRDALTRILAEPAPATRGCVGIFTDATGDKRFDTAWWHRFLAVFKPGVGDYAVIEFLSSTSVRSQLDLRCPCFYSGHVRKVAAVLANLAFFVSADCGVMHLGSAAGVPTAGIFKTTDPAEWCPYGGSNFAIDARNLTPEATAAKVLSTFREVVTERPKAPSAGTDFPPDEQR